MAVTIHVHEGGSSSTPSPQGDQQRRVFWAKLVLCLFALGALQSGSMASLILIPAAAAQWAPARRWMAAQWAQVQRRF